MEPEAVLLFERRPPPPPPSHPPMQPLARRLSGRAWTPRPTHYTPHVATRDAARKLPRGCREG